MSSSTTPDDGFPLIKIFNIIYKGDAPELKPEDERGIIKLSSLDGVVYAYNVREVDKSMLSIEFMDGILVTSKVPLCAFQGYIY